jgi:hypothetical protein
LSRTQTLAARAQNNVSGEKLNASGNLLFVVKEQLVELAAE